jgi:hypothetical protein
VRPGEHARRERKRGQGDGGEGKSGMRRERE